MIDSTLLNNLRQYGKFWSVQISFIVWEGDAKINRWSGGKGRKKIYEKNQRRWEKVPKKPAKVGEGTKKNHGRWDEKNLEARLPTAPLGVEISLLLEKVLINNTKNVRPLVCKMFHISTF